MPPRKKAVGIVGHICLDMSPRALPGTKAVPDPGTLTHVGSLRLWVGGVLKMAIATQYLGVPTYCTGAVGEDEIGPFLRQKFLRFVRAYPEARNRMSVKVLPDKQTSYTIVDEEVGRDRSFRHNPGVNDDFTPHLIDFRKMQYYDWLHFGYLNLMRAMWENNAAMTVELFKNVKKRGLTTSLDVAGFDPSAASSKADWSAILKALCPYTDFIMPNLGEALFLLDMKQRRGARKDHLAREAAQRFIDFGCAGAVIKMDASGLYVRVTDDETRLELAGRGLSDEAKRKFCGASVSTPAIGVEVQKTTGAGDITNAAFIAACINGNDLQKAARFATAGGAYWVSQENPNRYPNVADLMALENQASSDHRRGRRKK